MKKNISINISGIIFHIEEDGYEQLRAYLDQINVYFSAYEDSGEIIADIESRIAEIFLMKLKEGKQVITLADVKALMATMGSIQDFEAIEEEPKVQKEDQEDGYQRTEQEPYVAKRLFRDSQRKILGGVAAGIANYFNIDPLWIRLVMIILFFDIFISLSIGSVVLIGYIICWIVIPASNVIEEDRKIKKMFRNPDNRVLGGVSGGLAAYFGIDATVVRLLFVISIFIGGAGIIIYFILWIITPEAKSITDKMQMQGEPVTLSGIETNIKKSLNVRDGEEENIIVKILLFPFRLLAIIFAGLGKAVGPLLLFFVEAIRIVFGILLIAIAASLLFALLFSAVILFDIGGGGEIFFSELIHDLPVEIFHNSFPPFTFIASFFTLLVPFLALALLGISVLSKRRVVNSSIGWSMFAVWIISIVSLAFTLPVAIRSFKSEGSDRVTTTYNLENRTAVLTINETGMDDYHATSLQLLGHPEPEFKLVQKFYSRGSSRQNALENAKMINYNVSLNDSILVFDSNIAFEENAVFRAQELDMILYIPFDTPFMMKEDLKHIIRNTIYRSGYSVADMEGNQWVFTENEGLKCITCPEKETTDEENSSRATFDGAITDLEDIRDFDNLEVKGIYEIVITQGNNYNVSIVGDEELIANTRVEKIGSTLRIQQEDRSFSRSFTKPKVKLMITMPELVALRFSGITSSYLEGFTGDNLEVDLSGSSRSEFNIDVKDIQLDLSGDAKLTLTGKATYMEAKLSGASRLLAEYFEVIDATVESNGISSATVNVTNSLNKQSSGASTITNVSPENTTQSMRQEESSFYISKAHMLYYAALLKAGLHDQERDLTKFVSSN